MTAPSTLGGDETSTQDSGLSQLKSRDLVASLVHRLGGMETSLEGLCGGP